MKKTPISLKQFVINNLRKSSWKWPHKNTAKNKAKIARNQYICAFCKGVFPNKSVKVDHILPVVDPIEGFKDWDTYVTRMFCLEDGYQVLCDVCHDNKTASEREIRKASKKK